MSLYPVGQGGINVAGTVRRVGAVAATLLGGIHVNFLLASPIPYCATPATGEYGSGGRAVTLSVNPEGHFS